ncbi:PqiC family protein [Candidatus Thiothrix sp. Deng01]|uniref:PqiC family protein n=1 Tax=Candidatus Thiothrix phosphatis TaxID=3112415 RepID=A0ABU6CXZ7_9GAMM|nr:PqiC family protein [Candidatus Thiothrix sp. Deng01]MEB4591706.1 PqiC family protein [Candidatus Thiothrix sp. Deng01]
MLKNLLPVACLLLLAACSSSPTLYHTLAADPGNVAVAADVSQRIHSLGVGPVKLPTLLDREGMVVRKDATTVEVSDTHLWGGQLEDEFLSALSQQLQWRLPATRVQTVPWELSQTPQYQVEVRLDQFDGMPGGKAALRGLWRLQAGADGKILTTEPVALERKTAEPGVAGVVKAQSALVADLANQIVRSLAAR